MGSSTCSATWASFVESSPIGSKGARLTTQLSIPSRYLVYMPRTAHVGISLKIEDEAERERLKQVVSDCVALALLKEAGWTPKNNLLVNARGEPLRFTFLDSPSGFDIAIVQLEA